MCVLGLKTLHNIIRTFLICRSASHRSMQSWNTYLQRAENINTEMKVNILTAW